MPACYTSLLFILMAVPLFAQQNAQVRTDQWIWSRGQMMKADTPPSLDARQAQMEATLRDAAELSTLSQAVQSDIQQLRQGLLAKDLDQRLKRMEKLSRKLRREMAP
jgi:hypothetical protein